MIDILEACGGGKDGIRCLPAGGEEEAGEAVMVNEGEGEGVRGGWFGVWGFLDEFEAVERRFSAGEVGDGSSIELRAEVEVEDGRSAPAVAEGDGGATGRRGEGETAETVAGEAILMQVWLDWRERRVEEGDGG